MVASPFSVLPYPRLFGNNNVRTTSGWEGSIKVICKSDAELGGKFAIIWPILGFSVFSASPKLEILLFRRFINVFVYSNMEHFDHKRGPKCDISNRDIFRNHSRKTLFGCRRAGPRDSNFIIGSLRNENS
jgi:hypothetical protein